MNRNITVEEAARRLGTSVATIRRQLAAGTIPGQKIGGRWLVHGDKLPSPPPTGVGAANSGSFDVAKAWRWVSRTDRRELWIPDVLSWEDFRQSPDAMLSEALAKCSSGIADPIELVEVPKGDYLSRAGTLMSLPDRVAFHALCATFCHLVEERLSPNVFSSRINPGTGDFFLPGIQQFAAFEQAVTDAATDGRWVVETDLVSYFETISHQILFADLRSLGVPDSILRPLRNLLGDWRRESHHGLPIGMDASRLLGNTYLAAIDDAMLDEGYEYWRFMDDIKIVADSEIEALQALRRFEVLCRNRGLIVSGAKTTVDQVSKSRPKPIDKLAIAEYLLHNGFSQSRQALRDLFRDAITETEVKKKHAKFALLRLGSLVDRGVLKRLLDRLNRLKEVSPESAFYLRAFISEKKVQEALTEYLAGPGQPGIEVHQKAWLIAAMLEVLGEPPIEWVQFAADVAWDANQPTYLRGLAMNLVALGRRRSDLEKLHQIVQTSFDPSVVRGALAALRRIDDLGRKDKDAVLHRHPVLKGTLDYLGPRDSMPSLIQEGLWSKVRKLPSS